MPGVDHVPRGPLQADEGALEIDRDGVPPVLEGEFEERGVVAGAGVVDEDVEAAEVGDQPVDDVAAARDVAGVQAGHHRLASVRPHLFGGLLGARSSSCQVIPTSMPAAARATAVALPMPESEPVTIARVGVNAMRRPCPRPDDTDNGVDTVSGHAEDAARIARRGRRRSPASTRPAEWQATVSTGGPG